MYFTGIPVFLHHAFMDPPRCAEPYLGIEKKNTFEAPAVPGP